MALKFVTDESIEVDVNGKSYSVKVPSLKELTGLQKQLKTAPEEDAISVYEEFFGSKGLPLEATDKFTIKHWKILIEEFSGAKKD